ncbi:MAG: DUF1269 domain-containing protein [Chloroflexi bacterium]|nr:DUF1269 domain-containing protein [Chloroflexota bacterium]
MVSKNLVVIAFDSEEKAEQVVVTLKELESQSFINLEDIAIVVKDSNGKVSIKNAMEKTVKQGAAFGGFLGMFLGMLFLVPVGGLLAGAIGGAVVGKLSDTGVDKEFVNEVSEALQPGKSALFIVLQSANAEVALAALRPYEGKVLQTTLSSNVEEQLKRALGDQS